RLAAVVEDVFVLAPRILQCVGQNGHRGELVGVVHLAGEGNGRRSPPVRIERRYAERVAEDVADDDGVRGPGLPAASEFVRVPHHAQRRQNLNPGLEPAHAQQGVEHPVFLFPVSGLLLGYCPIRLGPLRLAGLPVGEPQRQVQQVGSERTTAGRGPAFDARHRSEPRLSSAPAPIGQVAEQVRPRVLVPLALVPRLIHFGSPRCCLKNVAVFAQKRSITSGSAPTMCVTPGSGSTSKSRPERTSASVSFSVCRKYTLSSAVPCTNKSGRRRSFAKGNRLASS